MVQRRRRVSSDTSLGVEGEAEGEAVRLPREEAALRGVGGGFGGALNFFPCSRGAARAAPIRPYLRGARLHDDDVVVDSRVAATLPPSLVFVFRERIRNTKY